MCTALTLESQSKDFIFGRTMDFSYDIVPQLFFIPRAHIWNSALGGLAITDTYRFIGLGQATGGLFGFFDGVNEKGFAIAALYFPGYAKYAQAPVVHLNKENVASIDLPHYILGQCSSVSDLPTVLQNMVISGIKDPVTNSIAPLHWFAADKSGACAVIESTDRGLELIDNPIGVMSNSPDLRWHLTNLRNYVEVSPTQSEKAVWNGMFLTPFGQAGGTVPLPGGFTSPERFVRTAYLKSHIKTPNDGCSAVTEVFHILENVSLPKGAVITSRNTYDYTQYIAVINMVTCEYFYRTYDNLQIKAASVW